MSVEVIMYSTRFCPYCVRARQLLDRKGVAYTDIDVGGQAQLRREMMQRSGQYTVPQIWIGDTHVGGYDDLAHLERQGALDTLLEQAS
ncbi:MAG: glutaredoxin 3 [Halioglobus sp.]|nr:glutaredoxin 3 [Halioglobus sp.]